MDKETKPKETAMLIRDVPVALRKSFHLVAFEGGLINRAAIIMLMRNYVEKKGKV